MAELSIIASVIQIADVGLRLSIKLYTFGEIVSTADKSVISISKDVSLTSSVLKELGALLDKDTSSRIVSENAVQTADKVVKECLDVFEEIETVFVKKMPNLKASAEEKRPKAVMLLERVKWSYLQPKLHLLRGNLDRLKSTLLLMLTVITYARQVAGRSEPPSVIENQRSLIEDLARSNQDYIRKFESLKLGIEDKPRAQEGGSQKDEFSKEMDLDLQERPQVSSQGTEPRKRRTPQEAHTPYMNTGDFILSTSAQDMPMTPELEDTKPRQEIQENGPVEADLFSHVKHYLSLVNNLLDEIDELKYDIRIDSRDRVKVDVLQAYKREINLLDTSNQHLWGLMAAKPIAPLVDSLQKHFHRAQQQQQSQPLIKHHQHEDKVRAANLQKSHVNHSNRAPAAPTTPFSFGGQSPQGVPQVYVPRKNELAQGKLVLPATKKRTRDLGKTYPVNQRDQETSAEFAMSPELVRDLPDTRLDHDAEDNAEAVSSLVDFARHSPPRTTRIQTVVEADDIAATAHHSQGRTNLLRHSRCPLVTIDKERRGNGCLTCRKRQTLCDEGLPICQKCIQSGSRCEAGGSADEGEARDRPFSHLSHTSLHTSGSGLHGHGSAEEGYKSSSPPARVDRASTGGLLEPSLARTQADFKPRTKRLRSYDGRSEGQGEQFQSDASGEENRNSHRRPRRPSLLFSEWQPPPGQTPPPSSPSLRNKVSPAIPSSSLSEGFSRPTLVGSRVARDSASRKSVSDPEAGRQTVLDSWKSVDFSSNFQPDLRLDSTKAFDDYDPDYANRRRNIVDDLIGLWTLLPVDRANI